MNIRMEFSRVLGGRFGHRLRSVMIVVCFFAGIGAQSYANAADASVVDRYPPGSINSVEAAERVLADVDKDREAVEARLAAEERACYTRFFVASCLGDAKERRRSALERLRNIENEAKLYERKARVEQRDKALAEKSTREHEAPQHQEHRLKSGTLSEKPIAPPKSPDPNAADRVADHERKMRQLQAEEAANAQKRAENIAAYQRKVEESQARQKEVEKKKAEKEQGRLNRQNTAPTAQ